MSARIENEDLLWTFAIREGTKNEYLTAAPDGRVVRWSGEDANGAPSSRQRWYISQYAVKDSEGKPVDTRYRIQNVGTRGFLHIGYVANSGYFWADIRPASEAEQTFSFELTETGVSGMNPGPFPVWLNIREHMRNEYFAVGSNGWTIGWAKTGGPDQRFYLERHSPVHADVSTLPGASKPEQTADQIPSPDDVTSLSQTPPPGKDWLVGEDVLAPAMINDDRYADPLSQAFACPYYRLQHWQRYDFPGGNKTARIKFSGYESHTLEVSLRSLFRREDMTSIRNTFSWNISGEVTGKAGGRKADPVGATAKLAFSVTKSEERLQSSGSSYENEAVVTESFSFNAPGKELSVATYALLNSFRLLDHAGKQLRAWETWDEGTIIIKSYPKLALALA